MRGLDAPDNLNVAGMGIILTTPVNLGLTEIRRGHAPQSGNGQTGIFRYYDIACAQNTGLNAALTFYYDDSELNGQTESALRLYRSSDDGVNWELRGGSVNSAQNNVALAGVDAFSRWTLANNLAAYDWGDAPEPKYATYYTHHGAYHPIISDLILGSVIDDDNDGQPDADAKGDDDDGTDDEDGVTIPCLVLGQWATIEVFVRNSTGNQAYLNAWIDWNSDGDWTDAGEQIAINASVVPDENILEIRVPINAALGTSFARFRLSSAIDLSPVGPALDGEVEDYQVTIQSPTTLVLAYPDGDALTISDPLQITWFKGDNANKVDLLFSNDNGKQWLTLATGLDNSGSFDTFVPGIVTNQARFKIVDSANGAEYDISDDPVTITGTGWETRLLFEAEDAVLTSPMRQWINGTAFGCEAIYSDRNNTGSAVFNFTVSKAGLYVLWGRAQAPGGTRNSFWISCDGGTEQAWEIRKGDGVWYWQRAAEAGIVLFNLPAGSHQITLRSRENYTRLDRIILTNDLAAEYHWMNPDQWVQVHVPHDTSYVVRGEPYEIRWSSYDIADHVAIDLSFDLGATFPMVITSSTPNDGSFLWQVPWVDQEKATLRIYEAGHVECPCDVMWGKFTFVDPPPRLWLVTPNGGETLFVGDVYPVKWHSRSYTGSVDLQYSPDAGTSWLSVAHGLPDSSTFNWQIPDITTDSALVRVSASASVSPADTSDDVFVILQKEEPPQPDFALAFDGIDDFVQVPHSASLNITRQFTIAFWLKTGDPAQKWRRILEKGTFDEYYVSFYGTTERFGGALRTAVPGGSCMNNLLGPSTSAIPANEWVHVALTYDGAITRLFLNGQLEVARTALAAPRNLAKDLIIGAALHGQIYEYHYQGMLDELSLWNVARTEPEVAAMLFTKLTGDESGLVACYDFDQGGGQLLSDLSPMHNNGRLGQSPSEDTSDPAWMVSDRPKRAGALAKLLAATKELDEEEMQEIDEKLPETLALEQNYPNPFNPVTTIAYQIPRDMHVCLRVFDLQGRELALLVNSNQPAGRYKVKWDAIGLTSGLYFYTLQADRQKQVKRMLLLK